MSEYTSTELLDLVAVPRRRIEELEARWLDPQAVAARAVELRKTAGKDDPLDDYRRCIKELKAERDDYRSRWEQTACPRHTAMEAAIKVNGEFSQRIKELEAQLSKCNLDLHKANRMLERTYENIRRSVTSIKGGE
jgi:hypothetical protein